MTRTHASFASRRCCRKEWHSLTTSASVPSTLAEDGNPLDVMVLMDEPAFAGCLVACRVVGAILGDLRGVAEGTRAARVRDDRLLAVALVSRTHEDLRALDDLNEW